MYICIYEKNKKCIIYICIFCIFRIWIVVDGVAFERCDFPNMCPMNSVFKYLQHIVYTLYRQRQAIQIKNNDLWCRGGLVVYYRLEGRSNAHAFSSHCRFNIEKVKVISEEGVYRNLDPHTVNVFNNRNLFYQYIF